MLDLGAGTGQLSAPLLAAGHDVVAVDTSADMLAQLAVGSPASRRSSPGPRTCRCRRRRRRRGGRPGGALVRPGPASRSSAGCCGREAPSVHLAHPEDTSDWSVAIAGLLAADARDQTGDRPESDQAVVDAFAVALDAAVTAHTTPWVHRCRRRPSSDGPPAAAASPCSTRPRARSTSAGSATCSPRIPRPGATTYST